VMGRKSKWSFLNEETAREYYLKHFEGMSRGELVEDKEGKGFYNALSRNGLLDILPESKHNDWSWLNEDTAREHYLENYEGMGRNELEKDKEGSRFYRALRRYDFLDIAFRPFHNIEEFNEHLEESGLLEDLFDEEGWVKDVDKFSEIVKEYCEYNCQTIKSVGDGLGIKKLSDKLNPKGHNKLYPEELDLIEKYMNNTENDRWKEYSLESEL